MIVISLSTVPAKLRGYLSLYLWEIDTNVYVGNVSMKVRELLWKRVEDLVPGHGRAVMVYPSDSEQGFDFKTCGVSFKIIDFEGLKLVMRPTEKTLAAEITPYEVKKIPRKAFYDSYVILDIEATGLDVENDRIIEIGAVKVIKGDIRETFQTYVKTEIPIPEHITELTGITLEDTDGGLSIEEAIIQLRSFLDNLCVIGYNIVNYDARMLHYACTRHNVEYPFVRVMDLIKITRQALPGLPSYSLPKVAEALNLQVEDTHRALSDCYLCNEVYQKIMQVSCD